MIGFALSVVLIVTSASFAQTDSVEFEDDHTTTYLAAIGDYYETDRSDIQIALDADLPLVELPVLFCIVQKSGTPVADLVTGRTEGESWLALAKDNGLSADDFYVPPVRKPVGEDFIRSFKKFEGLTRDEFSSVKLDDADIIRLVNLRFIYKYQRYSQHLVMRWSSEGKDFPEINYMITQINAEKAAAAAKAAAKK